MKKLYLMMVCVAIIAMSVNPAIAVTDRTSLPIEVNTDTYISVGVNYHSDEPLGTTQDDYFFNTDEAGVYTFLFHPIGKISDFIISVKDRYYEEVFGERQYSVTQDLVYNYYLDANETYRLQLYAMNGWFDFNSEAHFDFAIYPPSSNTSTVPDPAPAPANNENEPYIEYDIEHDSQTNVEESYYYGDLYVVNCDEWVSLRREPNTSSERLARVPLGAKVTNCYEAKNGFCVCDYNGITGCILMEYLSSDPPTVSPDRVTVPPDDKYDLNQYGYLPVVEKGRGSLVFQTKPGGSFMKDHKFHDGDYIYVNMNWRQSGYAIAYENGEYGYVDASYIDWYFDSSPIIRPTPTDDRYDLENYTYRPVAERGRGSLVFQTKPGGSFMKNHKFHDGDYIYVNLNWRQNGYAIAYEDGEYGYVDASYIDW